MQLDIYPYKDNAKEYVAALRACFPVSWQVVVFQEFKPMQDAIQFTFYLNPDGHDLMAELKFDTESMSAFDTWFDFFHMIYNTVISDMEHGVTEEFNHENPPEPRL